jgi:hypothetical protein
MDAPLETDTGNEHASVEDEPMAVLPKVRRESLAAAPAGSLVTANTFTLGAEARMVPMLGLRVWMSASGGPRPAFVALTKNANGIDARQLVAVPGQQLVNDTTPVVSNADGWSIHVDASDWLPDFQMNFATEHSGLLLAEEVNQGANGLRLAVEVPFAGTCHLLHFDDWTLHPIAPQQQLQFAAARKWGLSLPGHGSDVQWLLK